MELDRLNQKLTRITNHLTFRYRWVPPGRNLKLPVNSRRSQRAAKRIGHELTWNRIHNNFRMRHQLRSEILSQLAPFLERIFLIEDGTRIQKHLDNSYEKKFHAAKLHQIIKFEKAKPRGMEAQAHYEPGIVNISKCQLTTAEESDLVSWGCRIHWLHLCRGVRLLQRVFWIWL